MCVLLESDAKSSWGGSFTSFTRVLRITFVLSTFTAFLCFPSSFATAQSNLSSPVGTNLNGVTYYTSEQPFSTFKTAGGWITRTSSIADTNEEALLYSSFLDLNGYPTTLTGGPSHTFDRVAAVVLNNQPAPWLYPAGRYVVLYDGEGTLEYHWDANLNTHTPGRDLLDVNPGSGGIFVWITSTDPNNVGNYIRNIRLVYAPTATATVTDPNETLLASGELFNPTFISRISSFKALRFMWWMQTLSNMQINWADRATPIGYFGMTVNLVAPFRRR